MGNNLDAKRYKQLYVWRWFFRCREWRLSDYNALSDRYWLWLLYTSRRYHQRYFGRDRGATSRNRKRMHMI